VSRHPEDEQARQLLDSQRGTIGERRLVPRPPVPQLP
jgi:hypothetical protein